MHAITLEIIIRVVFGVTDAAASTSCGRWSPG
jgi:hypothetical protein